MLKAYISPLGIGFGHASRCLNLARKLREEGFEVFFSAYGDAVEYLRENAPGANVLEGGEEIAWKQKPDGQPDIRGTLSSLSEFKKFVRHLKKEKENLEYVSPDVVISDSKVSTLMVSQYLGIPNVVILNQPKLLLSPLLDKALPLSGNSEESCTFLSKVLEKLVNSAITRFWGLAHASIIADFPPPHSISRFHTTELPKPLMDRVVFTGPLIEPRCPDREGDLILIMISGPGEERRSLARSILEVLNEIPKDLRNYEFVVSLGEPGRKEIVRLDDNIKVYSWLPEKWESLSKARVVVSRAGHTTISEALMCGKPLLLIPVPGQTEKLENAKSVQEMGLGLYIEQEDVRNEFFRALRSLLDARYKKRVEQFKEKYEKWNFLDRAIGVIESILY